MVPVRWPSVGGEARDHRVELAVGDELGHGEQLAIGAREERAAHEGDQSAEQALRVARVAQARRGHADVALDGLGAHRVEDRAGFVDERHAGRLAVQRRAEGADYGVGASDGALGRFAVGELPGDDLRSGWVSLSLAGLRMYAVTWWPAS